ncbi:amidohydrolase family protein [Planctomyces sp. SH-PL14]|uniref:amidohydrolase family protein n=1 Tax=Planctomyces sp. SH-PL14 TaxID=1632864 RepID=UPI0009464AB7|nr:amidohydrolase family protein [Planctomyces sp. SH-PL14]
MRWVGALLLVLAPLTSMAQEVVVLRDVRLFDGTGAPSRDHVDIVIRGTVIDRVEPTGTSPLPEAKSVDGRGTFVVPGLISAHSHVGQVDGVSRVPENYNRENVLRQLRQYEVYGVTTIVALGTNQEPFYGIRREAHAGTIPGADLFGADRGIGVRNGAPSAQVLPSAADSVDRPQSVDEARAVVRQAKDRGTDLIKMWVDDSRGTMPKMTCEVYSAVIDEAHRLGLRVSAHLFNLQDARGLVEAGVDIIAHGVRDQPVDRALIDLMKAKSVWYVATLALDDASFVYADRPAWMDEPFFRHSVQPALQKQFDDPAWREKTLAAPGLKNSREALKMNQRNLAILFESGVQIGFGTDSGAMPLRIPGFAEHRELELMVEAGLTPAQALAIATGRTADLLKLPDRGTIAAGVYTSPEIAQIGLTEGEAAALGRRCRVVTQPLAVVDRAVIDGAADGVLKLVLDARSERLLGAMLICDQATALLPALGLLLRTKAKVSTLGAAGLAYPTLAGVFGKITDGLLRERLTRPVRWLLRQRFRWLR